MEMQQIQCTQKILEMKNNWRVYATSFHTVLESCSDLDSTVLVQGQTQVNKTEQSSEMSEGHIQSFYFD